MPNTVGGVIVDPSDKTIVVTIVNAVSGSTPTLYTARNGVVTVASPATITTKKEFHFVSEGTYTVSATTNGVACIGFPETVFIGSGGITTLEPEVDPDLYDASLVGTYGAGSTQWLQSVGAAFGFAFTVITASDAATGLPTAATVRWPDGTTGAFTGTIDGGSNGYSGFTAAYGAKTLTASGITYNTNGIPVGPTSLAVA